MKLKSFLIKILLTSFFLCIVVFALNKIYILMDQSDSDYVKKFDNVPNEINICNLGSSHGLYGFYYDGFVTEYTCFNFALASQKFVYDKRILEYYKDRLAKGCIVFIPVSYFSFYGNPQYHGDGFESENKRYYKFLTKDYIISYDGITDFLVKFPVLTAYENIINVFLGKRTEDADIWSTQTADSIDLASDVEAAYNRHIASKCINGKQIINNDNISALYDIIEICKGIDAKPILVTTPFMNAYTKVIKNKSPNFYVEFSALLDSILKKTGVEYYDYSHDSRFENNYELFMNGDHLNKNGAALFTDIIVKDVTQKNKQGS